MQFKSANNLYTSTAFRQLRQSLMIERADPDGVLRCCYCGKPILKDYDCIAHHVEEVTAANLNNPKVTLNPSNIQLVHHKCHNTIHDRFGRSIKKVYYVWGSPCSGKSSFVRNEKMPNDLIADIDLIWQSLTDEKYQKPEALKSIVFQQRDNLYEQIKMRAGKWQTAYVISAEPRRANRQRTCEALGAEPIYLAVTREEALRRLNNDNERQKVISDWTYYINNFFENLEEEE